MLAIINIILSITNNPIIILFITNMEGADRLMKVESNEEILSKRRQVNMAKYEEILDACSKMDLNDEENLCQPEKWDLKRPVLYLGTQNHKRIYSVNGVVLN